MAGKSKGVAAVIARLNPKALYTHCASHRLNLCVVKCCSLKDVANMMSMADAAARFFNNSPKRQLTVESRIESILQGEKRKKLKEMCRIRWIERHEAFEVFTDHFIVLVSCLEDIVSGTQSQWNSATQADSHSLLLGLSQFSFCMALVATQNVLAFTKGLSKKLQGRYVDVAYVHQEISTIKTAVQEVRSNVDVFHEQIFKQATLLAGSVGIEVSPAGSNTVKAFQLKKAQFLST